MSYGIRVFHKEFGLSWMKARQAAKLFKGAQVKWPTELQELVRQKSPSGAIVAFPKELAAIVAEFVTSSSPSG
jgi:hypothetical protein